MPKCNSSLSEMATGKLNIGKSPDMITFQQKCFHQKVEQYILISINLLLLGYGRTASAVEVINYRYTNS